MYEIRYFDWNAGAVRAAQRPGEPHRARGAAARRRCGTSRRRRALALPPWMAWQGTILAPRALVTISGGNINGSLPSGAIVRQHGRDAHAPAGPRACRRRSRARRCRRPNADADARRRRPRRRRRRRRRRPDGLADPDADATATDADPRDPTPTPATRRPRRRRPEPPGPTPRADRLADADARRRTSPASRSSRRRRRARSSSRARQPTSQVCKKVMTPRGRAVEHASGATRATRCASASA